MTKKRTVKPDPLDEAIKEAHAEINARHRLGSYLIESERTRNDLTHAVDLIASVARRKIKRLERALAAATTVVIADHLR